MNAKIVGLDYFFMATDIIPETYPGCTCSVHSSLRSTSTRRKYGEGTEQVHSRKGTEYRFIHFGVIMNIFCILYTYLHWIVTIL